VPGKAETFKAETFKAETFKAETFKAETFTEPNANNLLLGCTMRVKCHARKGMDERQKTFMSQSEVRGEETVVADVTAGHGDVAQRIEGHCKVEGIEVLRTMAKVLDVFAWSSLVRCENGSLERACGYAGIADYHVEWSVPKHWANENLGFVGYVLPTKVVREVTDRGRRTEVHMDDEAPVVLYDNASQLTGSSKMKERLGSLSTLFLEVEDFMSTVVITSIRTSLPHRRGPLWPRRRSITFENVRTSFFAWEEEEEDA
jgi:hypothetical protein